MNKINGNDFKASFSLIELIVVLLLISIISYIFLKPNTNELDQAVNRLLIYLKQTRLQANLQNFHDNNNSLWHKQRWTLKFFRCKSSVGGLYYVIYSDTNQTGHPSASESLKDPLSKKNIYSSNSCSENQFNSSYVLLTQQYNISDVRMSCNSTSSLGQLSFGEKNSVYSKLSANDNEFYEYKITEPCIIKITHKNGTFKELVVVNDTGYIYKN